MDIVHDCMNLTQMLLYTCCERDIYYIIVLNCPHCGTILEYKCMQATVVATVMAAVKLMQP